MKEEFIITSYTKKELALLYFPTSDNPHSAVNRLMAWIGRNKELCKALEGQGYKRCSKWFSPREVKLIIEYLGLPFYDDDDLY